MDATIHDISGERAGEDDGDVKEGLVDRAHEALRAGRISKSEYESAQIMEERMIQAKRYLLALLVNLENAGLSRNAFTVSIAAMDIIMWIYDEFTTADIELVAGYFSHPAENHRFVWPHMWVETKHSYFAHLWKKITGMDSPESRVTRMTDLAGGTKDLRDAVIMGQALALDERSVQLRYYRSKPAGLDFKKGKRDACMRAEKNNAFVRRKPLMWASLLDPRVAQMFEEAIRRTKTQDPRQLQLKRSQEEMRHFYDSVQSSEKEYERLKKVHES
jgi:hypothetical protein